MPTDDNDRANLIDGNDRENDFKEVSLICTMRHHYKFINYTFSIHRLEETDLIRLIDDL